MNASRFFQRKRPAWGRAAPSQLHFMLLAAVFTMIGIGCWGAGTSIAGDRAGEQAAASSVPPLRVLVLNSYHKDQPWAHSFDDGFRSFLRKNAPSSLIFHEYLDVGRIRPASENAVADYLQQKYGQTELDLLIVLSLPAVNYLKDRPQLLAAVPRLCIQTGLRQSNVERRGRDLILSIGSHQQASFAEMLQLAQPKRVYVVTETHSREGRYALEIFQQAIEHLAPTCSVDYLLLDTVASMKKQVAALPPESAIYYLLTFADKTGQSLTPYTVASELAQSASAPVFSYWSSLLGSGIVGGYGPSGQKIGQLAARQALSLKQGLSLQEEDGLCHCYDWRQLQRWHIAPSRLPESSQVLYRQLTLYEQHRTEFTLLAAVLTALITLSLFLLRTIRVRKKTEQRLADSEQYLTMLFDHVPIGLVLCRMDGSILSANPAYTEIIGYSLEETLQLTYWDLTPEEYEAGEQQQLESMRNRGRYGPYEKEYRHKDGRLVPVRLHGMVLTLAGEDCIWSSVEDITASKEAEKKRHELEEQLRQSQKMEAIGSLAGGIAHDFNNILAAILGYTELALLNPRCDPENKTYFQYVFAAAHRAKELVQQILLYSRKEEPLRKPVASAAVVSEAAALLRKIIPASIRLDLDLDPDTGTILADSTQLHQVVLNLGINAMHAVSADAGIICIRLHPWQREADIVARYPQLAEGAFASLQVEDNGAGMNAAVLARIFDPFFTTKEQGKGTGMGLPVVQRIVVNHQGIIWVESTPDVGTTVQILLPLQTTAESPEPRGLPHPATPSPGKGHILFVDDEPMLADVAKQFFVSLGYKVTVCASASEALAAFASLQQELDLVITDQSMPEMTGEVLAQQIHQRRPDLPIILCTGYNILDQEALLARGIRTVLLKPVALEQWAEEVNKWLGQQG